MYTLFITPQSGHMDEQRGVKLKVLNMEIFLP